MSDIMKCNEDFELLLNETYKRMISLSDHQWWSDLSRVDYCLSCSKPFAEWLEELQKFIDEEWDDTDTIKLF